MLVRVEVKLVAIERPEGVLVVRPTRGDDHRIDPERGQRTSGVPRPAADPRLAARDDVTR